jgi:hypothetical protein
MLWLTVALAEPCAESVRLRTFESHLADAQEAFAAARVVPGEFALADAREALSCLGTPVPPASLGVYAWLEAEASVWAHQVESAWPWVRLARDLGVASPAHLAAPHPIQRWITTLPPAPPLAGPEALLERPGHRTFVDGQVLDAPRVRTETPHFVQVFAGRELVEAGWQRGARFEGRWLTSLTAVPEPESRRAEASYWESWIAANPTSQWVPYAEEQLDAIRLRDARQDGGAGLEAYLDADPGAGRAAARSLLEPMAFDRAAVSGSRRALEAFLESYPGGRFTGDARRLLDRMDWEAATEQDTASAYDTYLARQPAGRSATEARRRLADRLVQRALHDGDPQALAAVEARFPWSLAGARAGAKARGTKLVAMVLAGDPNEELVMVLREHGLRVDRRPRARIGGSEGLPAQTGLVFTAVEEAGAGFHGRGELWLPGARAPVAVWRVVGTDPDAVRDLLVREAPDLAEWI